MLPAALGLCPGVTSMPSSLLCLEGNPNRHSREPVQKDLGCPPKRHDTIYNVSHKKADLDTGHNLMLQMGCWAPGRLVLSSRESGCVPLTLQSSVLYSRLPDCFFHPSLWASPVRSAHSALCLSIRYPGLAPISLPSLRQAICLHLLPAFLLGVLLDLLRPRRSGMGFTSTRSSAPPVSIMLPTNCLLSLYSALLGRLLEAIGSSGSLLLPGCVLFIVVPYFPEKIIGSLGLK